MKYAVVAALLFAPPAQDGLPALLEALSSGSLDERDAAQEKLITLGVRLLPDLRAAAARADGDLRARLDAAVQVLEIRAALPAEVLKAIPDADRRLADGRLTWHELVLTGARADADGDRPWPATATAALFARVNPSDVPASSINALLNHLSCAAPADAFRFSTGLLRCRTLRHDQVWSAIRTLRDIESPSKEQVADVRPFLDHEEEDVRQAAVRLLARGKVADLVAIHRRLLSDSGDALRFEAATYLAENDPDWLRDRLRELFETHPAAALSVAPRLGRHDLIAQALASIEGDAHGPRLVKLLTWMVETKLHEAWAPALRQLQRADAAEWDIVGRTVCSALACLVKPEDAAILDGVFESVDPELRRRASRLLADVPVADKRLLALSSDGDVTIRRNLAWAGCHRTNMTLARALLKDADTEVLMATMARLGPFPNKELVDAVLPLLANPSAPLRSDAVQFLLKAEATASAEALVPLLTDGSHCVRSWAAYTLALWGKSAHAKEIVANIAEIPHAWRGDLPDYQDSRTSIERLDATAVRAAIRPLIRSENAAVAAFAISLSAQDRGALPAIRVALASPSAAIRCEAVHALRRMGDRESLPTFLSILDDKKTDPAGQVAALQAIAAMGDIDPQEIVRRLDRLPLAPALNTLMSLGYRQRLPDLAARAEKGDAWESVFTYAHLSGDASLRSEALRHFSSSAALYLRAVGPGDDLDPLLALLQQRDTRWSAARVLALAPETALRKTVQQCFASETNRLRRAALAVVEARRWREFAPEVCRLSVDATNGYANEALDVLRVLGGPRSAADLKEVATQTQGRTGEQALLLVLDMPDGWSAVDPSMLRRALEYASTRGDSRAKSIALQCLASANPAPRSEAMNLLAALGDTSVLPELKRTLRDGDWLLAALGDGPSREARALRDEVAAVARCMSGVIDSDSLPALARLHNPEAGLDCDSGVLQHAAALPDPSLRPAFIRYFERRRLAGAVPLLLSWVTSRDDRDYSPWRITEALARIGGTAARDGLMKLLDHGQDRVAIAALDALVKMDAPDLSKLRSLLDRPGVRDAAINGLADLHDRASIPRFTQELDGPSAAAAARALARFDVKGAAPRIARLLDHPSGDIALAAADALVQLGASEFYPQVLDQSARRGAEAIAERLRPARWQGAADLYRREHDLEGLLRLGLEEAREPALAQAGLLSNSSLLWWLNALGNAEATEAFAAKPLDLPEGWIALTDVAGALAKSLGVAVTLEAGLEKEHAALGTTSRIEALLARDFGFRFALIVEKTGVRIVHRADAVAFWKSPAAARK